MEVRESAPTSKGHVHIHLQTDGGRQENDGESLELGSTGVQPHAELWRGGGGALDSQDARQAGLSLEAGRKGAGAHRPRVQKTDRRWRCPFGERKAQRPDSILVPPPVLQSACWSCASTAASSPGAQSPADPHGQAARAPASEGNSEQENTPRRGGGAAAAPRVDLGACRSRRPTASAYLAERTPFQTQRCTWGRAWTEEPAQRHRQRTQTGGAGHGDRHKRTDHHLTWASAILKEGSPAGSMNTHTRTPPMMPGHLLPSLSPCSPPVAGAGLFHLSLEALAKPMGGGVVFCQEGAGGGRVGRPNRSREPGPTRSFPGCGLRHLFGGPGLCVSACVIHGAQ